MKMIHLTEEIISEIKSHGEKTYPEECCGILLGKFEIDKKFVFEILKIENSRETERERRFLITPQDYIKAERYAREKGFDIVGIYHSHPDHPAKPSDYDREHALPFLSYIIVSVENGITKEINSWVLSEDRVKFEFEEIKIKNKTK
mgnify:CR=1 FL=1